MPCVVVRTFCKVTEESFFFFFVQWLHFPFEIPEIALPISSWILTWTRSCRRQSHPEVWGAVLGAFQARCAFMRCVLNAMAQPAQEGDFPHRSTATGLSQGQKRVWPLCITRAALSAQPWGLRQGSLIFHTVNSPRMTWAVEKNQPGADSN